MEELLRDTAERAIRYRAGLDARAVVPTAKAIEDLDALGGPLPEGPDDPAAVLALLDDRGSPATVASAGGRYFGFVTGSSLPVTVAANWLATAWDQNSALTVMSPVATQLEAIALQWLCELLGLPAGCGGSFVTGATDAHKWLNVPYDCGLAFVREPRQLAAAMAPSAAAYLAVGESREPMYVTPESSRRARGVEVWAALRSLGRLGVADLLERTCRHATRFAEGLREAGYDVLNQVTLNQVLVRFGDDKATRAAIAAVQAEGTCWCGSTVWQGGAAMRISVSAWATTEADVERSLAAIIGIAREVGARGIR